MKQTIITKPKSEYEHLMGFHSNDTRVWALAIQLLLSQVIKLLSGVKAIKSSIQIGRRPAILIRQRKNVVEFNIHLKITLTNMRNKFTVWPVDTLTKPKV